MLDRSTPNDAAAGRRMHSARWLLAILLMACPLASSLAEDTIWHIKAVHPDGKLVDVKALDKDGNIYDVKAFEVAGNPHLLDVKARMGGKRVPIKVLVSDERYMPVKAIGEDGTIYDVKALFEGKRLDVKGVRQNGNIIHIKAIGPGGEFWGIKAISAEGHLYDVKGVKMFDRKVEAEINGVPVHAHVKALPQVPCGD